MKLIPSCLALLLAACSGSAVRPPERAAAGIEPAWASYFPAGYEQSRDRFVRECARALAALTGYCRQHRVASASGEDLTIDYAFFTRGGPHLLVVQSGIHGVEGYAGAAVQRLLLDRYLGRLLDRGIDVLLIHALNPYGFKHDRRTDELNVNLNRNFSTGEAIYRTPNPGYEELRDLFEPTGPVENVGLESLGGSLGLVGAFLADGFSDRAISAAMNTGQYQFEKGLNFGGTGHQEQTGFLRDLLAPLFAGHAGKIVFLDIHTGLGEAGVLHMISGKAPSPALLGEAAAMLRPLAREGVAFNTASDPGFFATEGDVVDYVPLLADDPDRVLALTMEYGTVGTDMPAQLGTANRMILENQAHFHGCGEPSVCAEVRAGFRELFNPSDPAWRAAVLLEADRVFATLAEKL